MGSRAMESKERWFEVAVWRKREAYIALIRFIRKHLSYPQWDCYKLKDYAERQALNKTFLGRHFPLSNGVSNRLDGHLAEPQWSEPAAARAKPPPRKRVELEPERRSVDKVVAASAKPMVWDVENNCFVPF